MSGFSKDDHLSDEQKGSLRAQARVRLERWPRLLEEAWAGHTRMLALEEESRNVLTPSPGQDMQRVQHCERQSFCPWPGSIVQK